jgi:hypothetical protein
MTPAPKKKPAASDDKVIEKLTAAVQVQFFDHPVYRTFRHESTARAEASKLLKAIKDES